MSNKFPQYPLTVFGDGGLDSFSKLRNISSSELTLVNQFQQALRDGNYSQAQSILTNNPSLLECQLSQNSINKLYDCICALELMFNSDIENYIKSVMSNFTETALSNKIGDLTTLTTEIKTSLVAALNEHLAKTNIHKNIIVSNTINDNDGQPDNTLLFYTGT